MERGQEWNKHVLTWEMCEMCADKGLICIEKEQVEK